MHPRCYPPTLRVLALALATLTLAASAFAAGPKEKLLYSFQGYNAPNQQDGQGPDALISDGAGHLYGMTSWGGVCNQTHFLSYPCGTVFELTPPANSRGVWTETVIYEFGTNPLDGQAPYGNLIRDKQGNLYGTTFASSGGYNGNFGCGTFFELSPPLQQGGAWTETILYNFQGNNDGCGPLGTLVADSHGNIFGATQAGGALPKGTDTGGIFEMSPPATQGGSWTESFTQALGGGIYPSGGLTIDSKGNLYGDTTAYGTNPATVFQLTPPASSGGAWTGTTIYSFQGGSDGSAPAGLLFDGKGNIFGVTENGGTKGAGTAFELSQPTTGTSWTKTIIYSFKGALDGYEPVARMTLDRTGNLYGTTYGGGGGKGCTSTQGCGTVFKLTSTSAGWTESVLHAFRMSQTDGQYISSPVVVMGSKVYGTTNSGGTVSPYFFGTVFEIQQ